MSLMSPPSFRGSHEPAEDDPERPGQAGPQQPQRRPGRQQPAQTAADGEGATEAQAAGAAATEAAGQTCRSFTGFEQKVRSPKRDGSNCESSFRGLFDGAFFFLSLLLSHHHHCRRRCNLDLVSHARQTLSLPNTDTSRRAAPPGPRVYSGLRHNTTGSTRLYDYG